MPRRLVGFLLLLSACAKPDISCAPQLLTNLGAGDPCPGGIGLFAACPEAMTCCHTPTSHEPVCARDIYCRAPRLGEECNLGPSSSSCEANLYCDTTGVCSCVPSCSSGTACVSDRATCLFTCCDPGQVCIVDRCFGPPDMGPPDLAPPDQLPVDGGPDLAGDATPEASLTTDVGLQDMHVVH